MTIAAQPFDQRKRIRIARLGAVPAAGLAVFSQSVFAATATQEILELAGLGLILACVFGRLWCALYIGGVKNVSLVVSGPYSMTRNPLYVFSTLGVFGIGLAAGSFLLAFLGGAFAFALLSRTARKEADFLRLRFPEAYPAYEARTPLFWPRLSLYAESEAPEFSPKALKRTFLDALIFLAAFPLLEIVASLQQAGLLPVLFRLW